MITRESLHKSQYATFYGDENPYIALEGGQWVEKRHVYVTPEGGYLPGITGMLHRQLFPEKYKDVPQSVMANAAGRGTRVHNMCEKADKGEIDVYLPETYQEGVTEAYYYTKLRESIGCYPIDNEYTVSTPHFASCIDCVWGKDNEIYLADIKTYYSKDEEYLKWQLSVYAYMFERQNPHLKVSKLFGAWIYKDNPNKRMLIEVPRVPDAEVEKLMQAEIAGTQYLPSTADGALVPQMVIDTIVCLKTQLEENKAIYDKCMKQLQEAMESHNIKSWDAEVFKATITPESTTTSFDSARFKKDHPDLYNEYLKTTTRKSSIRLTLRNE